MFQNQQPLQSPRRRHSDRTDSDRNDTVWLSRLVDSLEKTSQPGLRAIPCEPAVLLAFEARLARPASLWGGCGLELRHIN